MHTPVDNYINLDMNAHQGLYVRVGGPIQRYPVLMYRYWLRKGSSSKSCFLSEARAIVNLIFLGFLMCPPVVPYHTLKTFIPSGF